MSSSTGEVHPLFSVRISLPKQLIYKQAHSFTMMFIDKRFCCAFAKAATSTVLQQQMATQELPYEYATPTINCQTTRCSLKRTLNNVRPSISFTSVDAMRVGKSSIYIWIPCDFISRRFSAHVAVDV